MNDLQLGWLIPTMLEVTGISVMLGVLGFAYENAIREKVSLVHALEERAKISWLAVGGAIFALGMGFTRAAWASKGLAILLALVLIALAWSPRKGDKAYPVKVTRQKLTTKSIVRLAISAALGIIVVALLAWGIHLGWHAYHLYGLARDVQEHSTQQKVENIVPLIGPAAGDIGAIYRDLRPFFPIFTGLKGAPRVGPYFGQVEPLLTLANDLAEAGNEITIGVQPLLEEGQAGETLPERASRVIQDGQEHFTRAGHYINQVEQVRNQINPEILPDKARALYSLLDDNFNLLVAGSQLLQAAPDLLGSNSTQSYLVLAQNRDELRATGGFISGIGLVTIQNGKITKFSLGDSYAVDDFSKTYPAPPEALKRFMLADYWVARDANWSPDFPTTAQQVQALYTLSTGVETQGVIAFNQLAVQGVLGVIGPVQVPGTDEPVSAENVENYMRQAWAPEPEEGLSQEWWLHRKDFMQQLGNVILEKALKSTDQEQLLKLGKIVLDLMDQGQILLYFNDPEGQNALETGGWDGAVQPGNGDYLYLVDSNVGFNKVDSVVQRSLTYQVDLSDLNHPTGKATMSYQNTAEGTVPCKQVVSYGNGTYLDAQQRCYLDYWRVLTPAGSELVSSNAQPVPASELLNGEGWSGEVESLNGEPNTQTFAGLLMVPLSASNQVTVSYDLPASILLSVGSNRYEYHLQVQKQPGLVELPFRIEIKVPESSDPIDLEAGWKSEISGIWSWQGVIEKASEWNFSFELNR